MAGSDNRNNHSSKKTKKKSSTLNRFNSDSVNPEKENGGVATAWELFLLKDHFNPVVAGAAIGSFKSANLTTSFNLRTKCREKT